MDPILLLWLVSSAAANGKKEMGVQVEVWRGAYEACCSVVPPRLGPDNPTVPNIATCLSA